MYTPSHTNTLVCACVCLCRLHSEFPISVGFWVRCVRSENCHICRTVSELRVSVFDFVSVLVRACSYAHVCVCTYECLYVCLCACVCACVCVCVSVCAFLNMYMYIYIHITNPHTHTHTSTHAHTCIGYIYLKSQAEGSCEIVSFVFCFYPSAAQQAPCVRRKIAHTRAREKKRTHS